MKAKTKLETAQVLQLFWPAARLPSLGQDPYVFFFFPLSLSLLFWGHPSLLLTKAQSATAVLVI